MKALRDSLRACVAAICILTLAACGGDNDVELTGGFPAPEFGAQVEDSFVATLDTNPAIQPAASTGTGAGTVTLDPATGRVVAVVTLTGTTPTTLILRSGAPGTAGPIVLALVETPPSSGIWTATATLTANQVEALRAGELYFDASSVAFPAGELRGQIVPQLATGFTPTPFSPGVGDPFGGGRLVPLTLGTNLRGDQVVPPAVTSAQAAASMIVEPLTGVTEVALATSGMVPTSAVVARGAPGENGEEILALTETVAGSGTWFGRGTLSPADLDALLEGNLYLLVRSAAFPEGELRGQLLPQQQLTGFSPVVPTTGIGNPLVPTFTDTGTGLTPIAPPGVGTTPIGTPGTGSIDLGIPDIGLPPPIPSDLGVTPSGLGTGFPGSPGAIGLGDPLLPTPGLDTGLDFGSPVDPFAPVAPFDAFDPFDPFDSGFGTGLGSGSGMLF